MRRVGLLFALAPIGCAKLNPAYGDESANGSRGGDTTAAEAEAETGKPTPSGSASDGGTTTSAPSSGVTTDVDPETGREDTGIASTTTGRGETGTGTTSPGSSETGSDTTAVLLVWANPADFVQGDDLGSACQVDPPAATTLCGTSPQVLIGTNEQTFADALGALDQGSYESASEMGATWYAQGNTSCEVPSGNNKVPYPSTTELLCWSTA